MYTTFTLPNGLKIIHNPCPGRQMVFVNLAYKVGSLHESPRQKGMAHFFEHMMFSPSQHIPNYSQAIQQIGGNFNAMTSFDTTQYLTSAPKAYLETIFWLESDRMFFPCMKQKELDIQKKIIIEELKQVFFHQPFQDLLLHLLPLAYKKDTPFSFPIIGESTADIQHITLSAIQEFGQKFYTPDNAVLAISGDFETKYIKELAQKWFSEQKEPATKRVCPILHPNRKPSFSHKTVTANVPYNMLTHAYHIPARSSLDFMSIQLVAMLLAQGKSAVFYKELVDNMQWVTKIEATPLTTLYGGLFLFQYHIQQGVNPATVQRKIDEILSKIEEESVDPKLLESFKSKVEGDFNLEKSSPEATNELLVYGSFMDDIHFFHKEITHQLPRCNTSTVKRVISRFFNKGNRLVLEYNCQA